MLYKAIRHIIKPIWAIVGLKIVNFLYNRFINKNLNDIIIPIYTNNLT